MSKLLPALSPDLQQMSAALKTTRENQPAVPLNQAQRETTATPKSSPPMRAKGLR